ncbi:CPBP family intramembrane metalloprotease [Butyrivibrio sp. CB08]|uniref:CPBP family intramembrane glutamic endopeptidase n=1 Tax=Butyrivibrio sp. CB08 TaxID=2364879 RepID=UPI000EA8790F|nr:CPBP family intramembrane glutamic endopeptidase [Butyrivibrio sp. CB08]RKM61951.1 CPBP family intramembrane metalloprotease [Butyrivibrio sp. CB08]
MFDGVFDFDLPFVRPKWYIYVLWAAIGAALAGVLNFAANITGLVTEPSFNKAATGLFYVSNSLPVLIILYCFATPLIEELLFRYFIFNLLLKYTKRAALSVVICAALFGLYHLNPVQMVYGFIMGLVITYSYYKNRVLTIPFLVHAAANAVALVFTFTL